MKLHLSAYALMAALFLRVGATIPIVLSASCSAQHFACPKSPRTVFFPHQFGHELVRWTWDDFKDYVDIGEATAYACPPEVQCDSMPVSWIMRPDKFGKTVQGMTTLSYIWRRELNDDGHPIYEVGCNWMYTNFNGPATTVASHRPGIQPIYKKYDCQIQDN